MPELYNVQIRALGANKVTRIVHNVDYVGALSSVNAFFIGAQFANPNADYQLEMKDSMEFRLLKRVSGAKRTGVSLVFQISPATIELKLDDDLSQDYTLGRDYTSSRDYSSGGS